MQKSRGRFLSAVALACAFASAPSLDEARAQGAPVGTDAGDAPADPAKFYKKPGYSPYAGRVFPQRPLWGDQHLHTGWSMDAGVAGATTSPEAEYA